MTDRRIRVQIAGLNHALAQSGFEPNGKLCGYSGRNHPVFVFAVAGKEYKFTLACSPRNLDTTVIANRKNFQARLRSLGLTGPHRHVAAASPSYPQQVAQR